MFCEKEEDFAYLCEVLDLTDVVNPKNKSVGRGRLVNALKVIHLIREGVKLEEKSQYKMVPGIIINDGKYCSLCGYYFDQENHCYCPENMSSYDNLKPMKEG